MKNNRNILGNLAKRIVCLLKICPPGVQPRIHGMVKKWLWLSETFSNFKSHCSVGWDSVGLGSRDQLTLLSLCQLPCTIASSLQKRLDFVAGMSVEVPRFMILGDLILPSVVGFIVWGSSGDHGHHDRHGLFKVNENSTHDSGCKPHLTSCRKSGNVIWIEENIILPSWLNHFLIVLELSGAVFHCSELQGMLNWSIPALLESRGSWHFAVLLLILVPSMRIWRKPLVQLCGLSLGLGVSIYEIMKIKEVQQ